MKSRVNTVIARCWYRCFIASLIHCFIDTKVHCFIYAGYGRSMGLVEKVHCSIAPLLHCSIASFIPSGCTNEAMKHFYQR